LIVQEVKSRSGNEGYEVATGEYVDLVKVGVVDPTKVTRYTLQNVASISALVLTTEALVTARKKNPLRAAWITKPQHSNSKLEFETRSRLSGREVKIDLKHALLPVDRKSHIGDP